MNSIYQCKKEGEKALLTRIYIDRKACVSELPSDHCLELVLLPEQGCGLQRGHGFEFLPLERIFFL